MEMEKDGEHLPVPPADPKVLSSKNPKGGSQDKDISAELLKSKTRTLRTGTPGMDVYKVSGKSYQKR